MRILAVTLLLSALLSGCTTCTNGSCTVEGDKVGPLTWSDSMMRVTVESYRSDGNGTSLALLFDPTTVPKSPKVHETITLEGTNGTLRLTTAAQFLELQIPSTGKSFLFTTTRHIDAGAPLGLQVGYSHTQRTNSRTEFRSVSFHIDLAGVTLP